MHGNTTMQKQGQSTTKKYTLNINSSGRPNWAHEHDKVQVTFSNDGLITKVRNMSCNEHFPPLDDIPKISPPIISPPVVERPDIYVPPTTYHVGFHWHMFRSFESFSALYHSQAQVHLHPSTRLWCLDLSTTTVSHAEYHVYQFMLVLEMNTKNERSEINYTVAQEEPQTTPISTTAKCQAKHHDQHFTLDHNYFSTT